MVAETFLIRLKKYISSHSLTSLVLHSWTLYTVVLIIQLKCFPKSFLKPDWRYCSDTSRAQFPVTQHLLSKQPLQPRGTTYTKKAITLHTPITGLHLTAYPGEETKSAEMRIWEMHFLYNPQWRPALPHLTNLQEKPQFKKKGSLFPKPVAGIHKGLNQE